MSATKRSSIKCPSCGKWRMHRRVIKLYKTGFEGVQIEVPNAKISKCLGCGEETYSASELKRWQKIKNEICEQLSIPSRVHRIEPTYTYYGFIPRN